MRSLILFRHAKSDWSADYGEEDSLRPLATRGEKAARTMGCFLANARQVPDSVITSPAERARTTIDLAARAGGWSCPIRTAPGLYGDVESVLAEISGEENQTALLLMVGHMPSLFEALSSLIGGANLQVPTASMTRVDLQIDRWRDIRPGTGSLIWHVVPRLFPGSPAGRKGSR